jgi:predicted kinase
MKIIVLGPPLSGKSTLAKFLRDSYSLEVLDFDEELLELNDGKWPGSYPDLNERLKKTVIERIISMNSVIFMAFEFPLYGLKRAKEAGFTVYQLVINIEELSRRNEERLKTQPNNDAFQYVGTNLKQQSELFKSGAIDKQLDATLPVEVLAESIVANLPSK